MKIVLYRPLPFPENWDKDRDNNVIFNYLLSVRRYIKGSQSLMWRLKKSYGENCPKISIPPIAGVLTEKFDLEDDDKVIRYLRMAVTILDEIAKAESTIAKDFKDMPVPDKESAQTLDLFQLRASPKRKMTEFKRFDRISTTAYMKVFSTEENLSAKEIYDGLKKFYRKSYDLQQKFVDELKHLPEESTFKPRKYLTLTERELGSSDINLGLYAPSKYGDMIIKIPAVYNMLSLNLTSMGDFLDVKNQLLCRTFDLVENLNALLIRAEQQGKMITTPYERKLSLGENIKRDSVSGEKKRTKFFWTNYLSASRLSSGARELKEFKATDKEKYKHISVAGLSMRSVLYQVAGVDKDTYVRGHEEISILNDKFESLLHSIKQRFLTSTRLETGLDMEDPRDTIVLKFLYMSLHEEIETIAMDKAEEVFGQKMEYIVQSLVNFGFMNPYLDPACTLLTFQPAHPAYDTSRLKKFDEHRNGKDIQYKMNRNVRSSTIAKTSSHLRYDRVQDKFNASGEFVNPYKKTVKLDKRQGSRIKMKSDEELKLIYIGVHKRLGTTVFRKTLEDLADELFNDAKPAVLREVKKELNNGTYMQKELNELANKDKE